MARTMQPGNDMQTQTTETRETATKFLGCFDSEEAYVQGLAKRIRREIETMISGTDGAIVDVRAYAPAKGDGWSVALSTEWAALKVFYQYRNGNTHMTKTANGWVVSVVPTR